jgi:hypothetical protein
MVDAWWMHGGLKVWQIKTVSTGHPSFGLFFQHEPRRSVSSMVSVFCGASRLKNTLGLSTFQNKFACGTYVEHQCLA